MAYRLVTFVHTSDSTTVESTIQVNITRSPRRLEDEDLYEHVYLAFSDRVDAATANRCADKLFSNRCCHDYDCCGQWYTSVGRIRRVSRRRWVVRLRHYRNL